MTKVSLIKMYTNLILHKSKQVHFPRPDCPNIVELKNAKNQFGFENTEFKIQNLRYIGLFPQPIVFKTERL